MACKTRFNSHEIQKMQIKNQSTFSLFFSIHFSLLLKNVKIIVCACFSFRTGGQYFSTFTAFCYALVFIFIIGILYFLEMLKFFFSVPPFLIFHVFNEFFSRRSFCSFLPCTFAWNFCISSLLKKTFKSLWLSIIPHKPLLYTG